MAKITLNWEADKEPETPHSYNGVTKESEILLISTSKGVTPGLYIKFKQDYNGHKKGDGVFVDMHYNELEEIEGYYSTHNIKRYHEEEEKPPAKKDEKPEPVKK